MYLKVTNKDMIRRVPTLSHNPHPLEKSHIWPLAIRTVASTKCNTQTCEDLHHKLNPKRASQMGAVSKSAPLVPREILEKMEHM